MAPPCFADLGKQARDLLSKTLDAGKWKVEVKSKTESGTKFKATTVNNTEKSVTQSGLESEFAWPDYGLKFVEKWNTDNQLSTEVTIEDQMVKGSKISFDSSFNPSSNKKRGVIKASYKTDYLNSGCDVDFDYAGPVIRSASVVGYKGWLAGYQMVFETPKSKLVGNNFAVSYNGGDYVVSASSKNAQEFEGSYYHKIKPEIEVAVCGTFATGDSSPVVSAASKYCLSQDTSVKAKVASSGTISLSLQQKVCDGVSMTLSSAVNATNFHAGGHKVGLAIEVDQ